MQYLSIAMTIICCVVTVINFFGNKKDKAVKDSKENHQELIEYQLKELKDDVKEILSKLDKYENDIDDKVNKAIDLHIKLYHRNIKKGAK